MKHSPKCADSAWQSFQSSPACTLSKSPQCRPGCGGKLSSSPRGSTPATWPRRRSPPCRSCSRTLAWSSARPPRSSRPGPRRPPSADRATSTSGAPRESLGGRWRWVRRFSICVSIGVFGRKAVSRAFLAQFLRILEIRKKTPQKQLAPKSYLARKMNLISTKFCKPKIQKNGIALKRYSALFTVFYYLLYIYIRS